MVQSRCGIRCDECGYKEEVGCKGCVSVDNPFWGSCAVKACCESRSHAHCGQCDVFPCDQLIAFAYAEKEGDNGKRIEVCRSWAIQGL